MFPIDQTNITLLLYLEDLKSSNIQDSNERCALALGPVQSFVDPGYQPLEEALIHGLTDSLDCVLHLQAIHPNM